LRWGLAAKLFATLILMGAIAVLVTGVLGYVRARETLEKVVFDQLTTARQTKTCQVETYFRTIHAELRLLATSKMVVEAAREFGRRSTTSSGQAPPELRQRSRLVRDTSSPEEAFSAGTPSCRLPPVGNAPYCRYTIVDQIGGAASFSTTPATAAMTVAPFITR
jgi:hypothetical protein